MIVNQGHAEILSAERQVKETSHLPGCSAAASGILSRVAPPRCSSDPLFLGNGPNTIPESTVSNTELSEFFGPHSEESDRGVWREEALQRPEIQASFLYPFSYAPLGEWGCISGELFGLFFRGLFVANPLPPTPFRNLRLTEFRGESSVSSSQPIICVPKRTHRVFRRTHRGCPKTQ